MNMNIRSKCAAHNLLMKAISDYDRGTVRTVQLDVATNLQNVQYKNVHKLMEAFFCWCLVFRESTKFDGNLRMTQVKWIEWNEC